MPYEFAVVIQMSEGSVIRHIKPHKVQPRPVEQFFPDLLFRLRLRLVNLILKLCRMTFQEGATNSRDDYGPERDYEPGFRRNRNDFPNSNGVEADFHSCMKSFKCLGQAFNRAKGWLFALGKGYLYLLVAIIVLAILPTFLVR